MNKETEITIASSLNQMYEQGIDHAIATVKEAMLEDGHNAANLVNSILAAIVIDLQNLKAKG